MRLKYVALAVLLVLSPAALSAFDADLGLGLDARNIDIPTPGTSSTFRARLAHESGGFGFLWEMSASDDDRYPVLDANFGSHYFSLDQGGLSWKGGPLSLSAGRFNERDLVDSPYSLFISSKGRSALGASLSFDDGKFFFQTRWISLNANSSLFTTTVPVLDAAGVPTDEYVSKPLDRGLEYKSYGFHLGDFRLAFLESDVYTGRSFDAEHFLNPCPAFFIQYVKSSGGPWQQGSAWASDNENYIMGFLADYNSGGLYAYGQLLVDDFNANRFFHPESNQNPDKLAASAGARLETASGTWGLFAAMATKYTFESYGSAGSDTNYGYFYYPDLVYSWSGSAPAAYLSLEDNYVGFHLGENTLALRAEYANAFPWASLKSALEFTLSGAKSPTNPWQQYSDWTQGGQGTHFLDDAVLEKKLRVEATLEKKLGPWTFGLALVGGYVWNELKLADPSTLPGYVADSANTKWLYCPSAASRFFGDASLGLSYRLSLF